LIVVGVLPGQQHARVDEPRSPCRSVSLEIADAVSSVMAGFAHYLMNAARPLLSSMAQAFVHVVAQQPAAGYVPASGLRVKRAEQIVGKRHHHLGHDPAYIRYCSPVRRHAHRPEMFFDPSPPRCPEEDRRSSIETTGMAGV